MNGPRLKRLCLALLGAATVATLSGCSLKEEGDVENGRQLFVQQCGTCHILSEAGSTSVIGPDLDASFAAARHAGMNDATVSGIVERQIGNPRQVRDPDTDPTYMPADLVEGDDARDVAAYVGSVAGVPGIEPPMVAGGPGGQVYAAYGCGACHTMAAAESIGNTGPNLDDNLPGQSPAEIEESIVDPGAELVEGFEGVMPGDYGETIPPEDLELLVEFLADRAGEPVQGADAG